MNKLKFLPIGTVVKLKGAEKMLFIAGYKAYSKEHQDKIYDYVGYTYPEGFLDRKANMVFNSEAIDKVYYYGYKDKSYEKLVYIFEKGAEENE